MTNKSLTTKLLLSNCDRKTRTLARQIECRPDGPAWSTYGRLKSMAVKREPLPKVTATFCTAPDHGVQPARELRSGAVLVCVLVVVLIVGLLISQSLQTLLLVRRSDDHRQSLRQARELIELGEIVLRQNAEKFPQSALIVPVFANQPRADSDLGAEAAAEESHGDSRSAAAIPWQGSISFERLPTTAAMRQQVRITVKYRPGTPAEITATHTVSDNSQTKKVSDTLRKDMLP